MSTKKTWAYNLIVFVLRWLIILFTKRVWKGGEKLNIDSGIIIVSNHYSYFDPMALGHFIHDNGRPPRFLAKVEVFKFPIIGSLIRKAGQIPVYRKSSKASDALREATAAVLAGEAVVIYPEGTLTHDPNLWPMTALTGAARLALTTQKPVIPIATWGAHRVIDPWTSKPHLLPRKTMFVQAGDPIDLSSYYGREIESEVLKEVTELMMSRITHELAILRGEQPPKNVWDRKNEWEPS
ncbi:MAG: hypothetical protein RIS09_866 [Actinomycetota bacterium]|jgi:1-acyl-sn-glycerol-3-phosphate acyltransferase